MTKFAFFLTPGGLSFNMEKPACLLAGGF